MKTNFSKIIQCRRGFSLLDVIIASVAFIIAVVGAFDYRYQSALDARKALILTSAVKIAQLVDESWCGSGTPLTYNPTTQWSYTDITIAAGTDPKEPSGFKLLNSYKITATPNNLAYSNNFTYYTTLSYQDISNPSSSLHLYALNVKVAWSPTGGAITDNSPTFMITSYK